jgi:peptidyl-prolyl cis-trans isomerase C
MASRSKLTPQVCAAAAALLLGGCARDPQQSSQVVATVNDHELTASQLSRVLQALGADGNPQSTRKALATLVDEELLVQQAMKDQLDRDPVIAQAMEHARRHLLAQAYAERKVYPQAAISPVEMEQYYRAHPALFAQRRLYRLTVFAVQNSDMSSLLSADLEHAHSETEVREALQKHEIKFETQYLNCAAEELPLNKIDGFARAKVGDLLIGGEDNDKTLLMSVVAMEDRPLSFEHAKPMIAQYLTTVRNSQAADAYLRKLRQTARIAYAAQYAATMQQAMRSSTRSGEDSAAGSNARTGSSMSAVASAHLTSYDAGLN